MVSIEVHTWDCNVHSILVILAGKALNLGVAVGSTTHPICFKDRGIGFQLAAHRWVIEYPGCVWCDRSKMIPENGGPVFLQPHSLSRNVLRHNLCEFLFTQLKWWTGWGSVSAQLPFSSLGSEFSSQGHFHTLQLLNVPQFLFCRVVMLKTAPRYRYVTVTTPTN